MWRTFGARGLLLRCRHEWRRIRGAFRSRPRYTPASDAESFDLFNLNRDQLSAVTDAKEAIARGDRVVAGTYQAFRSQWLPLPSAVDEWRNLAPNQSPWWRIPHTASGGGDVKRLWEPARFAWVYDLVRAYLITRDPSYCASFCHTFHAWLEANPPFMGVQWSCGQETAVRAVALLYAEANFALGKSLEEKIRLVLAASGERIADAIGYAESQRNNHALSEAAALVLLGLRFRGTHPEALAWRESGERIFVRVASDLFEQDGWYAQHSFTYLRVALEQAILVERGLRADGTSLPQALHRRIRAALRLTLLLVDENGDVPNHGSVDGALPHPVCLTGYRDFRPTLYIACALFGEPYPADIAPCPDALCWNRLPAPANGAPREDGIWSGRSGWAVVRREGTQVFLRAGRYRTRPSHIDPLHLDVRIQGHPVIVDAGTYSYVPEPSWPFALDGEEVHNGPSIEGVKMATRGPRFLWWQWPEAAIREVKSADDFVVIRAEVPGIVQRLVRVSAHLVEVEDEALQVGHPMLVRWLLHPSAAAGQLEINVPTTVYRGTKAIPWGWYAPNYGERVKTLGIECRSEPGPKTRAFITSRIRGSKREGSIEYCIPSPAIVHDRLADTGD